MKIVYNDLEVIINKTPLCSSCVYKGTCGNIQCLLTSLYMKTHNRWNRLKNTSTSFIISPIFEL